ncbi:nuclear matrix constituent protein 1-like [Trifolium pratense]|uniref:nuclear matrix constituent protein 1-like n=1 Tax=Trifolium pratense TaxID=57577 RepID=UPI001E694293|nr:nuclear matrix constituent protein 1-like [Trifolium pratense]
MMDVVEVSDKPKICGGDDENFKVPVSCEDFDFEDDDDVPLILRFSQISRLGTCSNKHDSSVKKKTTTTTTVVPVKRVLDNTKSLHISVKDSKVSLYDDQEKNDDDIRLSDIKMPDKSSDKCFSSLKINLGLLEKSFEACKRKKLVEKKRLRSVKRDIEECCKELASKKRKVCSVRRINEAHDEIQGKIEECKRDFVVKEKQLHLMEDLIKTKEIELIRVKGNITKEIELRQVIDKDRERKEEELKALSRKNTEFTLELKAKEKDLDAMNKLIGAQVEKLVSEKKKLLQEISIMKNECTQMKEFESMKKQFEGQVKELESKQKQCEGLMVELESNEKNFEAGLKELESRKKELEGNMKEFESKQEALQGRMKDLESKEKQVEGRAMELESREMQHEGREKEFKSKVERYEDQVKELEFKNQHFESQLKVLESVDNQLAGQVKDFESKKQEFECQMKELASKQKHFESRKEELESKETHFEGRVKELESREKQLEGHRKEFESKEEALKGRKNELELKEFEGRAMELQSKESLLVKELESKKKHFESRVEEFKSEEKRLKGQAKELESKEKKFNGQVKKFGSKVDEFEGRVKELESEKKHFKRRLKELEFKEKQFEEQMKEFQSKEEEFIGQVKELESKKEEFKGRVKEFESKTNQFEGRWKALVLKEKQFEEKEQDPESRLNKFDGQMKEPKSRKKYIDKEKESVTSYMNDELSCTVGGTSEKTDGVESLYNSILVNMRESSDPSRLVLDMIQNPVIPLCKKGDNAEIIADYHIYLLEQLMRITPNIKPCVREEALKLALDLKAYMKDNTENSLTVLGFLLLLSIFGLLTSFNEDEVLELFASVSQHNLAIELFGILGFANKVSDFVKNLIMTKQFVAAVRFSCAYCLADKNQLVVMLREHIQNAKLICDSSCEKTNSIEIKDKARDREIASLGTVLQCILDCNLQSEDMLLDKDIKYRILELKAIKGI